ncbi:MAG TPA: hypothetical protein DC042_15290 [Bacteroidales bacterium]|nr:hypothetical protein [Bacteroidales bacterium]
MWAFQPSFLTQDDGKAILMKRTALFLGAVFAFVSVGAQIQVRPIPEPGFEQRIRDFVNQIKVVDTHEHLLNPAGFDSSMLDFMLLFRHYATGDFESAGMPRNIMDKLFTDSLTSIEKWRTLEPYWERCFNTGYNRAAVLAAEKLFGVKAIDETTVAGLSEKIRKAYQTDWYDQVLRQKCNIEYVIEDYPFDDWENRIFGNQNMFRYVRKFDGFVLINSRDGIKNLGKWKSTGIQNLDDLVNALDNAFHQAFSQGIVAVKSILAYNRTLFYGKVTKEEAQEVFNKIMNAPGEEALSFDEVKPLQDYMMRRVLDLADSHDLPVQLHTGLNGGTIENAKPTNLTNLFREYPDVRFILFHGGYPYGGELAVLAKKFNNVYIDLCWLYIISPSFSERYLHEWLETVPASKIMAFGGDFLYVENVYSHLLFAREIVSNVLIDKVRDGYFSEVEAIKIAQMLFHDNAIRILNLKRP